MCRISLRKLSIDPALVILSGRFDLKHESCLKRLALKLVPIESWRGHWGSTRRSSMKLQQLKYLLAIVDNGLNITAAADRLYTSQPGVSKQLKLLEEELGLQLFTRKGKSLEGTTAAGHQVIERARLIMQEVENIRNLASDYYQEEEGTLSIGTTHTQARYVLPEVVKAFRQFYPSVNLNLHQGTSEQIADMVAAKEIDFRHRHRIESTYFSELLLLPSYRWDRTILVPNDHELAALERKLTAPGPGGAPVGYLCFQFWRRVVAQESICAGESETGCRIHCP